MAIYWIDPFIPAAVDNGTDRLGDGTDTTNYNTASSRTGTYANPFRLDDWKGTSSSATTVNGVTIATSSEVRIKGKTMNDMSDAISDMYASSSSTFTPVDSTGVTNLNNSMTSNAIEWVYLHGTNIDAMYPEGVDTFPIIAQCLAGSGSFSHSTDTGNLNQQGDLTGLIPAVRAAGFDSTSNPFCTARTMKTGYMTSTHALSNADGYYWFSTNGRILKVSAGWTSETAQNGYSIAILSQADAFERQYWVYNQSTTHLDCGRLFLRNTDRYLRWGSFPRKTGVVHEIGCLHISDYATYPKPSANNVHCRVRLAMWWANAQCDYNNSSLQVNLYLGRNGIRHNGDGGTNQVFKVGSIFKGDYDHSTNQRGFIWKENRGAYEVQFLNKSAYIELNTNGTAITDTARSSLTTHASNQTDSVMTYPATLYRAGTAGHWLSGVSLDTNPKQGGNFEYETSGVNQLSTSIYLTPANWWEKVSLSMETTQGMMPVRTVGRLLCNSQNYKTTANTISSNDGINVGTSNTQFPAIFACETNDYDNKPVTIVPSTATTTKACLVYNETVGSNEVVVMNGGASGQTYFYPIEVQVPTTFDPDGASGVDQVRAKITLSRVTSNTNNVAVYYYYRSNTGYNGIQSIIQYSAISTNDSSPTTHVTNLTIPESGLKKFNSVIAYVRFAPYQTTDILKIHDVFVELY